VNPQLVGTLSLALLGVLSVLWMFWDGPYTREIKRKRPGRYLTRYALRAFAPSGKGPWRVYLHQFHGADDDGVHNHPWKWAFSIVLRGSYTETLMCPCCETTTTRRVRWFNWITSDCYHRIEALHGNVWTLFFAGPLSGKGWGFWREGRHVPFEETIGEK
jgi:hypothetical protein